jgi:hypothetical protein
MGHLSRKPTRNDPPKKTQKDWMPDNERFALFSMSAIRCCSCGIPVLREYIQIDGVHVFCPDCKDEGKSCSSPDNFNHHYNVFEFGKHNGLQIEWLIKQ